MHLSLPPHPSSRSSLKQPCMLNPKCYGCILMSSAWSLQHNRLKPYLHELIWPSEPLRHVKHEHREKTDTGQYVTGGLIWSHWLETNSPQNSASLLQLLKWSFDRTCSVLCCPHESTMTIQSIKPYFKMHFIYKDYILQCRSSLLQRQCKETVDSMTDDTPVSICWGQVDRTTHLRLNQQQLLCLLQQLRSWGLLGLTSKRHVGV